MSGCTTAAVRSTLRELSHFPGVRSVWWGSPGSGGMGYTRGRRTIERERARPVPRPELPRLSSGAAPVLEVELEPGSRADPVRVSRWHALLAKLHDAPERNRDADPSGTRLHDAAQVLTRIQLDLATTTDPSGTRVRTALAECARLLSGGEQAAAAGAEPTLLAPLVAEEVRRAQAVDRRGVPLGVDVDVPAELELAVSGSVVRRVLRNLLVNALQASPDGARVRVNARRIAGRVEIEVADAGRGLSARERGRLFEAVPERVRGTGFGSRSIAQGALALGAELAVASTPGRGTTIRCAWPVRDARPVVAVLAACPRARERIGARWEAQGFRVVAAADPARLLGAVDNLAVHAFVLARGTELRTDDGAFVRLVERAPRCTLG